MYLTQAQRLGRYPNRQFSPSAIVSAATAGLRVAEYNECPLENCPVVKVAPGAILPEPAIAALAQKAGTEKQPLFTKAPELKGSRIKLQ
jgi:hypothetical protein